MANSKYLTEDGAGGIQLEDGSGVLLLEEPDLWPGMWVQSHRPKYAPFNTALIVSGLAFVPPITPTTVGGGADSGVISNIQIQYQSKVEPSVSAYAAAYDPSASRYAPSYPDWVASRKSVTLHQFLAWVPQVPGTILGAITYSYEDAVPQRKREPQYQFLAYAPQHSAAEGSALDWTARFADFVIRHKIAAANQPTLSITPQALSVLDIGWHVQHPAAPPIRRTPATNVTYTVQHQPAEGSALDWRGLYADFAKGLNFNAALQQPLAFWPFPLPSTVVTAIDWYQQHPATPIIAHRRFLSEARAPIVPLVDRVASWMGRYADAVYRPSVHASSVPSYWSGSSVIPLNHIAWDGRYPAQVWAKASLHASRQMVSAIDPRIFSIPTTPAPVRSWAPSYPDWIARRQIHAYLTAKQTVQPHKLLQVGAVSFSYPDQIWPKPGLHASEQRAFFGERFEPQPIGLAFHGKLPDQVHRIKMHPSRMPFYWSGTDGVAAVPSPALSWEPQYPDWVARQRMMPIGHYTTGFLFIPLVSLDPRFMGVYPSTIDRKRMLAANQPVWSMNLSPIPNPAVVELSWKPSYPSQVRRTTIHPSRTPFIVTSLLDWTFRFWYPRYPDQVYRKPQTRLGQLVRTIPVIAVPDIHVTFADSVKPLWRRRPEMPSIFQPNLSTLPSIGSDQGWGATFPDAVERKRQIPFGLSVWSILQPTFSSQVDCILIEHADVAYSTMVAASLHGSTFTEESLTTPDHIGIQTC